MRNKFFTCAQMNDQRFDDYVTELRQRANKWEFGHSHDSLIKDMEVPVV